MTSVDDAFINAPEAEVDAETVARELAKLSPLAYDQRREEEAKRLGVRAKTLDDTVRRIRGAGDAADGEKKSPFTDPGPWPSSVDGAELLDEIAATFTRFLVLPDHSAEALALWCLHAHAHEAAGISPILALLSPTKQCGKTTTIKVVSVLVPKPMHTINTSPSVLFRVVEAFKPTVLVDEGDTFLKDNDDLRGILNGGHDRLSAFVWRNVGDDHEPRRFKVWAPKAIAMIGRLHDTLEDRAIVVPLRRRREDEVVERFRADRIEQFSPMLSKAARWAADNLRAIADRDPKLPDGLDDRAQDNWRILTAIADQAGGRWPDVARAAAVALSSEAAKDDDGMPPGVRLLSNIREVMAGHEEISSTGLVEALIELEEAPWREWRRGNPISTHGIVRLLKPYKIRPHRGKGASVYRAVDLRDAWSRYLDNGGARHPETKCESATCDQSATGSINDINGFRKVALGRTLRDGRTCDVRRDEFEEGEL
jgi:putative DNA primase/helicase